MSPVVLDQLEVPDYDLGLRGKLLHPKKLASGGGLRFCTIVHGLSVCDEVTDTRASNAATGYPDAAVLLDESTRVTMPWRDGAQAVIGDLVDADGCWLPVSARGHVARLQEEYADLGLTPVLGFEFELWLHDVADGRVDRPLGRTENAYSLSRGDAVHRLASEFATRMDQIGIVVEAFHSELGPGFFEFALEPQPALIAADRAARARQHLRDLAAQRGLHATFMAKPHAGKSGAGGHVHCSLADGGGNVFSPAAGELSVSGAAFVAGLVETMGDLSLMLNPNVNSFKRLDKEMFTPESATWGIDDRGTACRVVVDTVAGARVEHRRPGADANPYLVAAAVLAGGLVGLREELALPAAGPDGPSLPSTLASAIGRFEASPRPTTLFGEEFVQAFSATRRTELAAFERWLQTTITAWETDRYREHL